MFNMLKRRNDPRQGDGKEHNMSIENDHPFQCAGCDSAFTTARFAAKCCKVWDIMQSTQPQSTLMGAMLEFSRTRWSVPCLRKAARLPDWWNALNGFLEQL